MDITILEFDVSTPFLIGLVLIGVVLLVLIGVMAVRAHKRQIVSGREEMLGMQGIVASVAGATIYAEIHSESWRVRCNEPLSPGDRVRVVAMDGLVLQVTRVGPSAAIRH